MLLRKPRTYSEVYNDLDGDVVNVFRVLQDPTKADQLARRIALTPFSRAEFTDAYTPATSDVDGAAKMIVRAFMGFGSPSANRNHVTGFRANALRNGTVPAVDWANWPAQVVRFTQRLRGVVIENRDALAVMAQQDSADTLHYVDPPYVQETRSALKNANGNRMHYYPHDMTDEDHRRLTAFLQTLNGMVVLSGYRSELYDEALAGWSCVETQHHADGARPRIECLWLNPAAANRQSQTRLFEGAG